MSAVKYNLYFHCSENTAFYIFMAVKYSFFEICIIFSVFHYFVYNKIYFLVLLLINRETPYNLKILC